MARVPRLTLPSPAIYHVTSRGVARCDIFLDDEDCRRFLALLERVAKRRHWRCPAYTLMSNHYHLLVESRIEELSAGMRTLNGSYAQHFNERHARVGHLFQGRFDVRVLRDDEHLVNACEYIWNNPVRVGRCVTAADWPWNGRV
jgi:REP-associated tyrosine transposase